MENSNNEDENKHPDRQSTHSNSSGHKKESFITSFLNKFKRDGKNKNKIKNFTKDMNQFKTTTKTFDSAIVVSRANIAPRQRRPPTRVVGGEASTGSASNSSVNVAVDSEPVNENISKSEDDIKISSLSNITGNGVVAPNNTPQSVDSNAQVSSNVAKNQETTTGQQTEQNSTLPTISEDLEKENAVIVPTSVEQNISQVPCEPAAEKITNEISVGKEEINKPVVENDKDDSLSTTTQINKESSSSSNEDSIQSIRSVNASTTESPMIATAEAIETNLTKTPSITEKSIKIEQILNESNLINNGNLPSESPKEEEEISQQVPTTSTEDKNKLEINSMEGESSPEMQQGDFNATSAEYNLKNMTITMNKTEKKIEYSPKSNPALQEDKPKTIGLIDENIQTKKSFNKLSKSSRKHSIEEKFHSNKSEYENMVRKRSQTVFGDKKPDVFIEKETDTLTPAMIIPKISNITPETKNNQIKAPQTTIKSSESKSLLENLQNISTPTTPIKMENNAVSIPVTEIIHKSQIKNNQDHSKSLTAETQLTKSGSQSRKTSINKPISVNENVKLEILLIKPPIILSPRSPSPNYNNESTSVEANVKEESPNPVKSRVFQFNLKPISNNSKQILTDSKFGKVSPQVEAQPIKSPLNAPDKLGSNILKEIVKDIARSSSPDYSANKPTFKSEVRAPEKSSIANKFIKNINLTEKAAEETKKILPNNKKNTNAQHIQYNINSRLSESESSTGKQSISDNPLQNISRLPRKSESAKQRSETEPMLKENTNIHPLNTNKSFEPSAARTSGEKKPAITQKAKKSSNRLNSYTQFLQDRENIVNTPPILVSPKRDTVFFLLKNTTESTTRVNKANIPIQKPLPTVEPAEALTQPLTDLKISNKIKMFENKPCPEKDPKLNISSPPKKPTVAQASPDKTSVAENTPDVDSNNDSNDSVLEK